MHPLLPLPPAILTPLILSLVMAAWDVATRRIPNFLTFGGALAGIAFQTAVLGWQGLAYSLAGLALGLALLILPYILGGFGAGDVKALAALGAWLGPSGTVVLFCFMGVAGGIISLAVLLWQGTLWPYLKYGWIRLVNLILLRGQQSVLREAMELGGRQTAGIPYGVAIALGMVCYARWGGLV